MKQALIMIMLASAGVARAAAVAEIRDPSVFGQVVAISDVHGMFAPLQRLLRGASIVDSSGNWTAGRTLLIVVGDSIDKGPDSLDVIDTWMRLMPQAAAAGGLIVPLLGNHEAEFLADPADDAKAKALYNELKKKGLPLSELTDPSRPRARFLRGLPLAARVGRWLFAHAGLYPKMAWNAFEERATALLSAGAYNDDFLTGDDSILEAKEWWSDDDTRRDLSTRLSAEGISGVVFGHQPAAFGVEGAIASTDDGHLIKIDNGMAPEAGAHPGHLLVFPNASELAGSGRPHAFSLGEDGHPQEIVQARK